MIKVHVGPNASATGNRLVQRVSTSKVSASEQKRALKALVTLRAELMKRVNTAADATQLGYVGQIETAVEAGNVVAMSAAIEQLTEATWQVVRELKLAWLATRKGGQS